jgi:hypothetical protein
MQLSLARSMAGGAAIGLGAAVLYRSSKRVGDPAVSELPYADPHFMNDFQTARLAQVRSEQAVRLDALLRAAVPAVEDCRRRANMYCGLFGRATCLQDRAAASDELSLLLSALRDEASRVSYGPGTSADDRDAYVATYGCVAWTEPALDALARRAPLIEVGAGQGQWARALRRRMHGADVLAFDDGSALPLVGSESSATAARAATEQGGVVLGVDGATAAAQHADRTLLLVAPPPGPQPARWLASFEARGGERLVYVGEGRGGAHADAAFFAALEGRWQLEQVLPLRPFPGGAERMWCLHRRRDLPRESGVAAAVDSATSNEHHSRASRRP